MRHNNLQEQSIFWRSHPENERYFYHHENGELILLRINNFPEEPLYTLINGLKITDMDEKPENWLF